MLGVINDFHNFWRYLLILSKSKILLICYHQRTWNYPTYQFISQIFIEHNVDINASIWEQVNSWLHTVLCNMDKLLTISQPQFSFLLFQMATITTTTLPCIIIAEMKTSCFDSTLLRQEMLRSVLNASLKKVLGNSITRKDFWFGMAYPSYYLFYLTWAERL